MILVIRHNLTISLYPFFEFLTDLCRRLLRDAASGKKKERACQADRANMSHPRHIRKVCFFLQS
jgi:hypothetical protein